LTAAEGVGDKARVADVRYASSTPRAAALRPYIARIWQLESDAQVALSPGRWALPDGYSEWLFVLCDPLLRGAHQIGFGAHVFGVTLQALLSKPTGRLLVVGVAFHPGCAAAALPVSAHELAGRAAALPDLWGRNGALIVERLAETRRFAERAAILEGEILARVRPLDPEVGAAVRRLAADPSTPVNRLVEDAAGARRLERKFLASVGVPPKRLARVFRLQRALRLWNAGEARGWADLAAAAGYADQAHLVREFSEMVGASPQSFAGRERLTSDSFKTAAPGERTLGPR
jgi:hypothetical protein